MATLARPARAARLSAAVKRAFGEDFIFEAYETPGDVNDRPVIDVSRPVATRTGVWRGPSKSMTPKGRGSASDDRAHNFTASFPSVNFEDAVLPWAVRQGDKITRVLDGTAYRAGAPYADGHGRTTVPLTSKVR